MKTIVFDFDDTITTFDTIFPFLFYANKDGYFFKSIKQGLCLFFRTCYRFKLINNFQLKDRAIKLLIGNYSQEEIKKAAADFFQEISFHETVARELNRWQKDPTAQVYISTASFLDYVELLKETYPQLIIQASELNYQDGKVTGLKSNNYGAEKMCPWKGKRIDVFYSDSLTDLPLAQIANKICLITKNGVIRECDSLDHFIQLGKT